MGQSQETKRSQEGQQAASSKKPSPPQEKARQKPAEGIHGKPEQDAGGPEHQGGDAHEDRNP